MDYVTLNTGTKIPAVGFGTWKIVPDFLAKKATKEALEAGYRHIDTARIYHNEKGVGRAIKESGVAREDIFLTTKLWNADQGYEKTLKAFEKSLQRLDTGYVDLYLMHWPVPETRHESWRAMAEIYKSGRAKAIGVSNFQISHLDALLRITDVVPAVNQCEFHPFLYDDQVELLEYCKHKGVVFEAYSPLAHGKVTDDDVVPAIARHYHKNTAQIILRWCLQHETVVLPKSTNPEHMRQNLDIFDFKLTADEMRQIDNLSDGTRTCWNPSKIV